MEQMIFAALQVPAFGLLRTPCFHQPKMDQSFLEQVVLQSVMMGNRADYFEQGLSGGGFIQVHSTFFLNNSVIAIWPEAQNGLPDYGPPNLQTDSWVVAAISLFC